MPPTIIITIFAAFADFRAAFLIIIFDMTRGIYYYHHHIHIDGDSALLFIAILYAFATRILR